MYKNTKKSQQKETITERVTLMSRNLLNFADASIFFAKNQHFLAMIVPLLKAIV